MRGFHRNATNVRVPDSEAAALVEAPSEPAASARRVVSTRAMTRYAFRRTLQAVPTIGLIVLTTFLLLRLAPGDIAQVLAGEAGGGDPEYLEKLRATFGLDEPLPVQFGKYLFQLAHFNLGYSFRYQVSVSELIGGRLATTLLLMITGLALAIAIGVPLGTIAARYQGRWPDKIISGTLLVVYATPNFLLGIALILLFAVQLRWLPIGGFIDPLGTDNWTAKIISVGRHLALPALTLGLLYGAIYARLTRSTVSEIGSQDYVLTARAKGISPWRLIRRHLLRNALLPLVTLVGMQTAGMIGGAVLIETIFAWPGIGRLAFEAVFQRDYNLLCGIVLCSAILVVLVNLAVDLIYTVLDPRVSVR